MKVWRSGFMRWRRREGPWGSHHDDARALKCDTSVGSTVPLLGDAEGLWRLVGVLERKREAIRGIARGIGGRVDVRGKCCRIDRAAIAGL